MNLERSLRLEDRLSGHLVWGHVDGVGHVTSIQPEGDSFLYTFAIPADLVATWWRKARWQLMGLV